MLLDQQFSYLNIGQGPKTGGNKDNRQKRKEKMNELPSLYVSNLPKESFFDLDFYKHFTNRGFNVKSAKIVLDSKTSKSRGYGYLQFRDKEEADRCLNAMNNTKLQGQELRIVHSSANPKGEFNEKANLLVKNIDKDVT
jgi:RNA recognition motif-containing protein